MRQPAAVEGVVAVGGILSLVIDIISSTLVLALVSLGLAVIFGLIRVINMGHGAMLALGAYFTWAFSGCGCSVRARRGRQPRRCRRHRACVLERFVIRHFYDQPFETLLISWGFFLVATELIKIIWGSDSEEHQEPAAGNLLHRTGRDRTLRSGRLSVHSLHPCRVRTSCSTGRASASGCGP